MGEKLIIILGPTALGKTKLAAQLAFRFNGEIISADSRQVYKHMNIGTGKDYDDYIVDGCPVLYHLIDIVEPSGEYDVFKFKNDCLAAIKKILLNKKLPFIVGGTGMYVSAILKNYTFTPVKFEGSRYEELQNLSREALKEILLGLRKNLHNITDLVDQERMVKAILIAEGEKDMCSQIEEEVFDCIVIGVNADRKIVKENITKRLKARLDSGMIQEVEELLQRGITFEKFNFFGLEYRYTGMYIKGELNYNDMFQKLNSAIHAFAKRQMTWFRKMEREGININWIKPGDYSKAESLIQKFIS